MEMIIRRSSVFHRHNAALQLFKEDMSKMLDTKRELDTLMLSSSPPRAAIRDKSTGIPYFAVAQTPEIPYISIMQTVIETPAFLSSAKDEGISDEERQEIVTFIAKHPSAGDLMEVPERSVSQDGARARAAAIE